MGRRDGDRGGGIHGRGALGAGAFAARVSLLWSIARSMAGMVTPSVMIASRMTEVETFTRPRSPGDGFPSGVDAMISDTTSQDAS